MRLTDRRVRTDKWYTVGFSPVLEKYILAVTVGWYGYYDRYYEISREEYERTLTEPEALDKLAEELFRAVNKSERFICSDKADENSPVQNELAVKLLAEKNEYYSTHPEAVKDFVRY
jgi:hypothetical protein